LESWVKTSGGKGLHVVVPIERRATWEKVSAFSRGVAQTLEKHAPDRYLSRAAKAGRSGRIFIDWLRNTRGATAVAAWSTRARTGAPVSLPCDWAKLSGLGRADALGVAAVLADGVPYRTDPWQAMLRTRQRLPGGVR
jgi:bifunctional non-homologous end joining protein LigD